MTQSTTTIGRLGLADPDLGYDTNDGGVNLHAQLTGNWTKVADHLMWRYKTATLANTVGTSIVHNFGLALSKLKIIIIEAGVQLTEAQIASRYTITQDSTNQITVTNTSGISRTPVISVFGGKPNISFADLDPATSITTSGNIEAAELRADGEDIVLNYDAAGSAADWKATIRRPSSGMSAAAIHTLPSATSTLATQALAETLQNKTLTACGGITMAGSTTINWATTGNVSIGASIGASSMTLGGGTSTISIPGQMDAAILSTSSNDVLLNSATTSSGANWLGTIRRPSSGMSAAAVWTMPTTTQTMIGRTSSDTLTNKDLTDTSNVYRAATGSVSGAVTTATQSFEGQKNFLKQVNVAQQTTPAAPSAGFNLIYPKANDKWYSQNSAGVESPLGSGGGTGINCILSPNSSDNWAASGAGVTLSTTTTSAELPLAGISDTAIKVVAVSGTDYIRYRWQMPVALFNSVLPVSWYQIVESGMANGDFKVDMYVNSASNYSGSYTRKALRSDVSSVTSIPATSGFFGAGNQCSFDTGSDLYYELRIARVAGTKYLTVANVTVGPGSTGVANTGPYDYESVSTYTIGAVTTPPTPGTGSTFLRHTQKDGAWANIRYEFNQTAIGSAGSGDYLFPLPTGLSIDYSRINSTVANPNTGSVGTGLLIVNSTQSTLHAYAYNSGAYVNKIAFSYINDAAAMTAWGSNGSLGNGTVRMSINVRIPIVEWANNNPVVVGAAGSPQYYYSTGNTWGTSNVSATTAQGPGGVLGGTTTPAGTGFAYTFTPTYPIPIGLKPELEFSADGIHWGAGPFDTTSIIVENLRFDGTNYIGAGVAQLSSGALKVTFGKYSGGVTVAWAGTWYWRVKVAYPGIPALPYAQLDGSAQLYKAGSAPGVTGGAAIAAGYVGQTIANNVAFATYTTATTYENVTNISLANGNWLVTGTVVSTANGASSVNTALAAISGYSATTTTDHVTGVNVGSAAGPVAASSDSTITLALPVRCDGTNIYIAGFTVVGTTLYLKARMTWSSTPNPQRCGSITATRIC